MFSIKAAEVLASPSADNSSSPPGTWFERNKRMVIIGGAASAVLLLVGLIVSFAFSSPSKTTDVLNPVQLNGQLEGAGGVKSVRSISLRNQSPIVALAIKHWPIAAAIATVLLLIIVVVAVLMMRSPTVIEEPEDPVVVVEEPEPWWMDPMYVGGGIFAATVVVLVILWKRSGMHTGPNEQYPTGKTAKDLKNDSMTYFGNYINDGNPTVEVKNLRSAYMLVVWAKLADGVCNQTDPGEKKFLTDAYNLPAPTAAAAPNPDQVYFYDPVTSQPTAAAANHPDTYVRLFQNFNRVADILAANMMTLTEFGDVAHRCEDSRQNMNFANIGQWNAWVTATAQPIKDAVAAHAAKPKVTGNP